MTVFCKDCKHMSGTPPKCLVSKLSNAGFNLVTGEPIPDDFYYCSVIRDSAVAGDCGPEGSLFEPKDE